MKHQEEYNDDFLEDEILDDVIEDLEDDELEENDEFDEDLEDDELEDKILPKKKIKNKEKFYIQPKDFDDAILEYYKTNVITKELADMINKISEKLSYSPNFCNYSFKSDMQGDAVVKMFKALVGKKYTHDKGSNPFSYFTRIAFNAFICRIKKEKHLQEIHEKYKEELLMFADNYNTIVKNKNMKISQDR